MADSQVITIKILDDTTEKFPLWLIVVGAIGIATTGALIFTSRRKKSVNNP